MTITAAPVPEVDPTKPPPAEYLPDYDQFVTEDDAPVDNFFSEKQQRLLTEPLYSARVAERLGRPLLAAADRKSTRLNSSHRNLSRMPSSA